MEQDLPPQQTVADILDLIEETKKESSYSVDTSSGAISFFPLNASHQKELIKALINSPYYSTIFNVKIYEILKSIHDPADGANLDTLTSFDKYPILIKVRAENIGDDYTKTFPVDGKDPFEKTISLTKHIQKTKLTVPEPETIKIDNYEAVVNFPSLLNEYTFERHIASALENLDENNPKALRSLLSTIYITNILKYIQNLKIKGNDVNFLNLSLSDKLNVGGRLPSLLTQKVVKLLDDKFGKAITDYLGYSFQHEGEKKNSIITIDNTFFTS